MPYEASHEVCAHQAFTSRVLVLTLKCARALSSSQERKVMHVLLLEEPCPARNRFIVIMNRSVVETEQNERPPWQPLSCNSFNQTERYEGLGVLANRVGKESPQRVQDLQRVSGVIFPPILLHPSHRFPMHPKSTSNDAPHNCRPVLPMS